jgi:phospholipase/lecithinase/hemolysin
MEPIQSVSANGLGQPRPVSTSSTEQSASAGQAVSAQASSTSMQVSATQSLSSTTVSQQVEAFLGSVDPALANNAYLKLLIAALIMQVLLGEDGGAQKSSAGLQGLEALAGGRNNSLFVAMETSTNTVQIAQQSTRLDVTSAVQSMSETGGEDTGAQMDVTG